MIEALFALLPGSIFVYRYAPGFQPAKFVGLMLMEIAPFLVVAWLERAPMVTVLLGFAVLYSIYELGYVENDLNSEKEEVGMTHRSQFDRFNPNIFYALRIPVIGALLYVTYILCTAYSFQIVACLVAIFCVFGMHNRLMRPRWRTATFISLNTLKIAVRLLFIAPTAVIYVLGALPHLVIKLLHYLGAKKVIAVSEDAVRAAVLPIYLGCLPMLVFVDPKLVLFGLPYFLNHFKSQLFSSARRLAGVRA